MTQKGPKGKKAQFLFHAINPKNKMKKMSIAKLNSSGWKDTACHRRANKKLNNIEKRSKMPYVHFIWTKLDSKSGQIKGLDVTFQMHGIARIFDFVKSLKN